MRWSCCPIRSRAPAITSRTSFTEALTADSGTNALVVASAISRANVVFPVPGGPQKMTDDSRSASISRRSGPPFGEQVLLTDHLVEPRRAQARRERSLSSQPLGGSRGEEVT